MNSGKEILHLSTLDYIYATHAEDPIPFVLNFDTDLKISTIEESFYQTCREFLGSEGCLIEVDDKTMGFDLSKCRASFEVIECEMDRPLNTIVERITNDLGAPLTRAYLVRRQSLTSIILCMSHAVADGYGYFMFLSAWAAKCRGNEFYSPNCDRKALTSFGRFAIHNDDKSPLPKMLPSSHTLIVSETKNGKRFRWKKDYISVHSDKYKNVSETGKPSINALISADIWKRKTITAKHSENSVLYTYVDIRRHSKQAGPLHFGNAVLPVCIEMPADDLIQMPLLDLANIIKKNTDKAPSRLTESLNELEAFRMKYGVKMFERTRTFSPYGCVVSNLSHIPLSTMDFGSGPPIGFDTAADGPQCQASIIFSEGKKYRILETETGK